MNIEKKSLLKQLMAALVCYLYLSSAYSAQDELLDLSVEDLLNVEVISVSKKAKSLNDSPAAIFVISQNDIQRIGATSIPEALRLAPGIDVARIDANKWAVSARGFNGRFANKLLVLIDGRNAYTRAFAGVYWENQDVMLEDVERIEVIRGPGATLWGANAVNGVINIITKHSADTQGGLLVAGAGNQEQGFGAFRYGGELNKNTTARAYVKGFKVNENTNEMGANAGDDWGKVQSGFRMDSQATPNDAITLQGDAYYSNINQYSIVPQTAAPYQNSFNEDIESFGGNLLVRHQHTFSSTSDYSLQVYYDFYQRDEFYLKETRHSLDIDFQHRFALLGWNDIVWGVGYRYNHDDFRSSYITTLTPPSRNDQLFSAFIQDEITLIDNTLWLTLGSKFEHNDYSGFEAQPTARLMWAPHYQHRLWASISRAVRTPSRAEQNMNLLQRVVAPQPLPFFPYASPAVEVMLNGNDQYTSEEVLSYEIGYRTTLIENVSIDLTAFYNNYSHLRSIDVGTLSFNGSNLVQPLQFNNDSSAQTYGFEIATVWQMLNWWRWDANYSLLKMHFNNQGAAAQTGISPQQQVSLRSAVSPLPNVDLDVFFRYVDSTATIGFLGGVISDYVSMDIRLAWRPVDSLELSLVGQNLLSAHHLEYRQESAFTTPTEIDRGVYGKLAWHF
ncbi:MAG: iron complex outermembrane recepter protein [Methyloprofundus sp.]|nr:MAG: iron complex outermembrane recepter protein [Methyloprofundus sp.]